MIVLYNGFRQKKNIGLFSFELQKYRSEFFFAQVIVPLWSEFHYRGLVNFQNRKIALSFNFLLQNVYFLSYLLNFPSKTFLKKIFNTETVNSFLFIFLNFPKKQKILFKNACLKYNIQPKYTKNKYICLKGWFLQFFKCFK